MSQVNTEVVTDPSRDLDVIKSKLSEHGFAVIPDMLSPSELAETRERFISLADAERAAAVRAGAPEVDEVQFVRTLPAKDQVFRDLVSQPLAVELARHVLGQDIILWGAMANRVPPGSPGGGAHSDQGLLPGEVTWPVVCAYIYMLDDFTEENGATWVVPGSHRRRTDELNADDFNAGKISAVGRAGSAIVMDGRLWHSIGKNVTTDQTRHGALTFYSVPYLRAKENWMYHIDPAVLQDASPELRELLGFKLWRAIGGPPANPMFIGGQSGVGNYAGQLLNQDEGTGEWAAFSPPWMPPSPNAI
jgi:ectoine hydroxylase-related dioxygenase (phytanoyl-CoA dioxygenase family)